MSNVVKVWYHGAMMIPLNVWDDLASEEQGGRCVPGRSCRLAESRRFDSEVEETHFRDSRTGVLAHSMALLKATLLLPSCLP